MGCRELIDSLRAAGDGKVRTLRTESEQEAGRIRAGAERRIADIRGAREREHAAEAAKQAAAVLAGAEADAKADRIRTERMLADRLARLARGSLPTLRNVGYDDVFASFVRELPRFSWTSVRVNPADVQLARAHFPNAEVVPDPGISGGLAVSSEHGQVQVVNTFEKRLERVWEDLLPDIIREVKELAP